MRPHLHPIRVYYEDTDAGGVVYHARYLAFAERARTEALRDIGMPHAELHGLHGLIFMVRRAKLDYLAPARLDDALIVETEPVAIRHATVDLRQAIRHAGRMIVDVEVQLACVHAQSGRPARIPARWRDALSRLQDNRLQDETKESR